MTDPQPPFDPSKGQQYPPGQQYPSGQQYASGQQYPPGQQFAAGEQYPSGQQYAPGQQYPSGQQYAPGQQYPSGQQFPQGQPYPSQPGFGGQPQYGAPPQGYVQPGQPPYGATGAPVSPADAKMWAMLAHLGGILLGWIAPLIVWLMYKDRDEFVRRHAVQALNFQILFFIGMIVSILLTIILIGLVLMPIVGITALVFMIMAGLAANKGEEYKYPINVPFVK
ncbi:DUF4870 domain-containing protein [Nocardia carnea]|uniref:DUF4870 domain-containing protein n=1 Tax=Nocardia carnea TaxID=37328 RepID=A0ABW7TK83_9NOCA|nr:DUF4870 domain-containing protein [Nocardia carnea]